MWPSMTFEVILYFLEYLRLYNDSIHVNFHQNQFINEYARENSANIPQSHSPVVFMRCRRTYIPNNNWLKYLGWSRDEEVWHR